MLDCLHYKIKKSVPGFLQKNWPFAGGFAGQFLTFWVCFGLHCALLHSFSSCVEPQQNNIEQVEWLNRAWWFGAIVAEHMELQGLIIF